MTALITRNDAKLTVSFTEAAKQQKSDALAIAGLIGRVSNADENAAAVEAQRALKTFASDVEAARKECKEPVLEYGRTIDAAAKQMTADIAEELTRVSTLLGDYQTLHQAQARAAKLAENEALLQIERERQAAIATAPSHEAIDAINEVFDAKARDIPLHEPTRANGQIVKTDWKITVTDPHALYRTHPNCVKLEPLLSEIKAVLSQGGKPKGVIAERITTSTVRATRQTQAIDV